MSMTFKQTEQFLRNVIANQWKRPLFLKGLPGIGKTSLVMQLGEEFGLEVRTVIWSQLAPVDVRGVPSVVGNQTIWNPPSFIPREGKGILFLDEFNMAAPAMQAIGQQLIQERQIGDVKIPDGWFIWATGNCSKSQAAVYDMPGPTRNRYSMIDVDYGIDDFRSYAVRQSVDESILGFLSFQEQYLHKMPTDAEEGQFPTPRSWFFCDELIKMGLRTVNHLETVIGTGVATEFITYCEVLDKLPNKEAIFQGKDVPYEWPAKDPSLQFAIITSLGLGAKKAKDYVNAIKWMMDKGAKTEYVVLIMKFMRDVFNVHDPKKRSPEFQLLIEAMNKEKHLQELVNKFRELMS